MEQILYLALFLPLAGFIILMFTSEKISRFWAGCIGCGTVLISFVCFVVLLYLFNHADPIFYNFTLFKWISLKTIQADFTLHVDPLSLFMTLIITGVGFLIHVYSNGYMDHDKDYVRFFACMNFFIFSMLLLVLAQNLPLLFVGWEGVGLASYLLIGFWFTTPIAAKAATKAFVMNRIGDCGFLIGILLAISLFQTTDIDEVSRLATEKYPVGTPIMFIFTLLFFIGAIGKSAQLPLFTWLPDAMAGPTPVSALIHAATMVTAGVYLIVRMHAVYMLAPNTLHLVAAVGGITSLFASLCAIGQTDLKKVLAYSTVSQLGLMFLACGVAAFYAAMFHLMTHAFVKALLFLSAGIVVHVLNGETQMDEMGGLAKRFKITHWLFLIGVLALSGIPPLSAFFSKDLILEQDYLAGFTILFYIGLAASILTGFYLIRAYCLTFLGPIKDKNKNEGKSIEAPLVMLIPVAILAILSVIGGFIGFTFGKEASLERFLAKVGVTLFEKEPSNVFISSPETWISIIGCTLGVLLSAIMYTRYVNRFRQPISLLQNAFFINEFYNYVIVYPLKKISQAITYFFEPKVFEGFTDAIVEGTRKAARDFQLMQSGQVRSYVAWMVIGAVFVLGYNLIYIPMILHKG